ncbi:MAG: hypothetical protein HKN78_08955 [Sphingomonadaceae bacterium]|nr:hypothetical protein [Sphingomonadaceae bacterium]
MGEEKFASLSSGLLARKGGAKPAMRRQNYINPQGDVSEDLGWNDMGHEGDEDFIGPVEQNGHDGGQNGHDIDHVPEVRRQIDRLADDLGGEADHDHDPDQVITAKLPDIEPQDTGETAEHREISQFPEPPEVTSPTRLTPPERDLSSVREAPKPAEERAPKKVLAREKAAFTLRLDKDRHLKLRLASAVSNRSAQQIVTEALDRFLETMPDIDTLAGQAPGNKALD